MSEPKKLTLLQRIEQVPAHFEVAAAKMEELGITDFYYFGGSVRDMLLKTPPNDIDIRAIFPRYHPFWIRAEEEIKRLPKSSGAGVFIHHISTNMVEIFKKKGLDCKAVSFWKDNYILKLAFTDKAGKPQMLDLVLDPTKLKLELADNRNDEAALNSFVMDRKGDLWGDEDALEHIANKTFAPYAGLSFRKTLKTIVRFTKIQSRIQDLTFQAAEDHKLLSNAWLLADKMTFGLPQQMALAAFRIRRSVRRCDI